METNIDLNSPILFYSSFCNYCSQFAGALQEVNMTDIFNFICIDVDPSTGSRPQIFYELQSALNITVSEVPTIVLNGGEYVLAGEEAFKWLQFIVENKNNVGPPQPQELDPYNPMEMGSFSDPYASVNSNSIHDAKSQAFKFLGAPDERIMTPEEERLVKKSPPKRNVNSVTPQFQHAPKPEIDFSSNRLGYAGQSGSNNYSKNNNIDARLQQLMAEREATVPPPPSRE